MAGSLIRLGADRGFLPSRRRQLVEPALRGAADAGQDVRELGLRIDLVQPHRHDQPRRPGRDRHQFGAGRAMSCVREKASSAHCADLFNRQIRPLWRSMLTDPRGTCNQMASRPNMNSTGGHATDAGSNDAGRRSSRRCARGSRATIARRSPARLWLPMTPRGLAGSNLFG